MNKNRQLLLTFILLLLFIILSCDPYKKLAEERAEKAASNEEISIAIVDSFRNTSLFEEGVRLAIKEINESGGLHGKTITPIFYDDELDPVLGQKISENIVQNTDIVAVIGHKNSNVAIPVSITYERSGLLFISTGAAKPELTQYGGFYTFRNIPSDEVSGKAAALFMKDKGYKKVLIIFDEDSEASQLVKIFGASAVENGIKIVAEKTYSNWETDFRLLIGSLMRKYEFDCVFLGGELVAVANMIKQMREMGIDKPIMGNDSLDSQKFWEIAGKAGENTIVFTVFDPNLPETATQNFVEAFKTEYDSTPDTPAAQGYDAMQVFSHAVEKGGTTVPIVVGNTLRLIKDWKGVTGPYSFNWNGGIEGKSIFFKQAGNQKFEFLHSKSKDKVNLFNPLEEITLRIPVANRIDTIDPGLAIKPVDLDICEQLFLNLTDFDHKTYEVIPELAKRWEADKDFKKYIFEIKMDIKWSNGDTVTAHDIVWAIRRNVSAASKFPNTFLLSVIKNVQAFYDGKIKDISQIGVKAIGDFLIEFELEYSSPFFPAFLSFPTFAPLHKKAFQKRVFKLTEPFFDRIEKEKLPSDIIHNLKQLENNEYDTYSEFINQLKITIGEKAIIDYKSSIFKHDIYDWTDENIVFKLSKGFFDEIEKEELPSDIINNLRKLKNNEYSTKSKLLSQLKATIGERQTIQYESLILKHAFYNWTLTDNIITNGSYMPVAWEKGIVLVLRKNKSYYDAQKVSIPEVRYYIIPNGLTALTMYNNQKIDIIGGSYLNIPYEQLNKIRMNKALSDEYSDNKQFSGYAYGFNTKKFPIDNKLVRKAISACINKELLIKSTSDGTLTQAYTFTPPDILGTKKKTSMNLDPAVGRKWLKDAGFPDGKGFPVIKLLHDSSEIETKIAKSVKTLLKHYLNIRVELLSSDKDIVEFSDANSPHIFDIKFKNYDTLPDSIIGQYFDPPLIDNYTGWRDPDFIKLVQKLFAEYDLKEKQKLCIEAEKILCNKEALIIPIYFDTAHYLVNTRVKGWYHMPIGGGQHIRDWSLR